MQQLRKRLSRAIPIAQVALLLLGLAGPAAAQTSIKFEVLAPAGGHEGLKVNSFTLYQGGLAGTPVASWSGILFSSGGASASFTVPVTAVPDAYRAVYEIPFGGEPTDVLIDTADFGFGTQYFMPNPSVTANPVTSALPDSGNDAYIELTNLGPPPFPDDDDAPTCDVTRNGLDVQAVVQDVESGLAEIEVDIARNLTVPDPDDPAGTTDPVIINGVVNDPERLTTLLLDARDQAGNRILCKSVTKHPGTSEGDVEIVIHTAPAGEGFTDLPSASVGGILVLAAGLAATAVWRLRRH